MAEEQNTTLQRQASVQAVFGFRTVGDAAQAYEAQWNAAHPGEPLCWDALCLGLLADMNASLPEPFSVQNLVSLHITGPELPSLPAGWTDKARHTFRSLDLRLDTYTVANVKAWRDQGHGGYPWPPPEKNPANGNTPALQHPINGQAPQPEHVGGKTP